MKQWANGSDVGVVCLYHRASAIVSYSGLHFVRSLSSPEQENRWSELEHRAKDTLDGLIRMLRPDRGDWVKAEKFLSERDHYEALVNLVALHHARSLEVPVQQLLEADGKVDSAGSEDKIRARLSAAEEYYRFGIELTMLTPDTPVGLGAVPVFDAQSWGGHEAGTARFMMPLNPWLTISGTTNRPPERVKVISSSIEFADLLEFSLAGASGLFSTPYLICEPSALERMTTTALALTEGGTMHWLALRNRVDLCDDSVAGSLRVDWQERIRRQKLNQGLCGDPTTADSRKAKIRLSLAEDARKIQTDLDALDVPVCACKHHSQNPAVSALWIPVMPQVICDTIRHQQKTR